MTVLWSQHDIRLRPAKRGCHLVTDQIVKPIQDDLKKYKVGLCNVFLQHTSASLTINENADPDVRTDMETFLNVSVPEALKRLGCTQLRALMTCLPMPRAA